MDKFLIQPTVFNYYSDYEEWLERNNAPASVLEAYRATRQNFLYTLEEKKFLKLVLSVLLAPGDMFCLILCKDNKGHVFLLNKHEVKPFFKVSRFWWLEDLLCKKKGCKECALYKGACSELVFGVNTFFEAGAKVTMNVIHFGFVHGLKEHLLKRRFWKWRLN